MRLFTRRELREAVAHAVAGGQALHLHRYTAPASAPARFRQSPNQEMAHLFDQDAERLAATARGLGVTFIRVHHAGSSRQHVDLTGETLQRAKARCDGAGARA